MVKISAVLPAYNVEKYLGQCIESIINQNIECEIIIVNDGSTDNTLSVAESYKEKYPFIKVFSQENCGQSTARNRGIENATGEYLLLLDSDDYLCPDVLNNLYDLCKQNDLDYIKCGWNSFVEGEEKSFLTLPKTESLNKVISSKKYFCDEVGAHRGNQTGDQHCAVKGVVDFFKNKHNAGKRCIKGGGKSGTCATR